MTQEEIQKQIEAVRGLIGAYELTKGQFSIELGMYLIDDNSLDELKDSLRTLTATLKPYLNGEKLEV